ncbi:HNH endonuclease [Archangium violaceum]|uniref:HNH endonuclease n=1 Tax=Archangium violaceum TaxID=83451 RepID=UPI002B2BB6C8|nr:HNH endonuclease [Archangium gephyra]
MPDTHRKSILGTSQVAARLLVASLLLAACATDGTRVVESDPGAMRGPHSRVQVRVETEEESSRTFFPPRVMPVEVTAAQFDLAMARLVAGLELPSPSRHRLALTACGQPGQEDQGAALTRGYRFWCERRGTPGDCLSLLGNVHSLGAEARRTLALTIALGSVWEGSVDVWANMVDPVALQSDDIHIGSGRSEQHMRAANRRLFDAIKSEPGLAKELGLSRTNIDQLLTLDRAPRGYIWHHHQDVCRMQLVQEEAHILSRPHTAKAPTSSTRS